MLESVKALVVKDVKVTLRNPILLVFSIVIPVVFILLYSLITQLSATNPTVIARNSYGPESDRLIEIMREMKSVDGDYFNIKTLDSEEAISLYREGKAAAMLVIPESFDEQLENKQNTFLPFHVHNINSDATKNYQLRVSHATYLFQQGSEKNITVEEIYSKFPEDVSIKLYISIGLLMFAVIYSSMINTGILLAREWEERTAKEISMSPTGFAPILIAKWISTFVLSSISILFVFLVLFFTLDFPIKEVHIGLFGWLFVLFMFGASLGSLIGIGAKKTLPIVTISGVLGITLYLVSGNESSIRGFAYEGGIEVIWKISKLIPISQITENIRYTFIPYGLSPDYSSLVLISLFIAFFIALSIYLLKNSLYSSYGQ